MAKRCYNRRKFLEVACLGATGLGISATGFGCSTPKHLRTTENNNNEKYLALFIIDGVNKEIFENLLDQGKIPNCREIYYGGVHSEHHLSTYIPATICAIPSMIYGVSQHKHGVPNFQFVDRSTERVMYYNITSIKGILNFENLISNGRKPFWHYFNEANEENARTVIDGLQIIGESSQCRNLIDSFIDPWREQDSLDFLAKCFGERDRGLEGIIKKIGGMFMLHKDGNLIEVFNPMSNTGFFDYLSLITDKDKRELRLQNPKIVVIYDPHANWAAYNEGITGEYVTKLIQADRFLGGVMSLYKKVGIFNQTYFVVTSDHGVMPVENAEYRDFAVPFREAGLKVFANLHELNLHTIAGRLRNTRSYLRSQGYVDKFDMVFCSNAGGAVQGDLRNIDGNWKINPTFTDLKKFPVNGKKIDIIEILNSLPYCDFSLARGLSMQDEKRVILFNKHGVSEIIADNFNFSYTILRGKDPLGYEEWKSISRMMGGKFYSANEWREATEPTEYPDSILLLGRAFGLEDNGDRAGTFIFNPQKGHSYNAVSRSQHGTNHKEELETIFAVKGPGLPSGEIIQKSRITDVAPTMLDLLGVKENFDFEGGSLI